MYRFVYVNGVRVQGFTPSILWKVGALLCRIMCRFDVFIGKLASTMWKVNASYYDFYRKFDIITTFLKSPSNLSSANLQFLFFVRAMCG